MTVYVVQNQHRHDNGKLVPKFDLTPAAAFGDLVYLLSPTARPFKPGGIVKELHEKLISYDSGRDYLLLLGNPCLIGMVVAIAAVYARGHVRMLQWDGRNNRYAAIDADLYSE